MIIYIYNILSNNFSLNTMGSFSVIDTINFLYYCIKRISKTNYSKLSKIYIIRNAYY